MIGNPQVEIFLLCGLGVFVQSVIFKKISDQLKIKEIKKESDRLLKALKKARHDKDLEKMTKLTNKMNDVSLKKLEATMNPNFISSIPLMLLFMFMNRWYESFIINLPFAIPYPIISLTPGIGYKTQLGWLGWYVLSAILWGQLVRKALGVEI
jgi:uncharacterized membrane protein (DUF106 family)